MAGWREVKPNDPVRATPGRVQPAAPVAAEPGSPADVLAKQESVGNRATSELLAGAKVEAPSRAPQPSTSKRRREEGSPEGQPERRRSTRNKEDENVDLDPILKFKSSYEGVSTQKLDEAQSIGFAQEATLTKPSAAKKRVDEYYEFRQEVRDGYESTDKSKDGSQPLGKKFVQDQTFEPPYEGETTARDKEYITFVDNPGWSTSSKIGAGYWLKWYTVFFRWKVKRKSTGKEWTSPEVKHSVESTYDDGNDAEVKAEVAGNKRWTVKFPT